MIDCHSSLGPVFGSGNEIYVIDRRNKKTNNSTNLEGSYRNGTGLNVQEVFASGYYFQVKEIEIFSITL
jgi:hypothetical protein